MSALYALKLLILKVIYYIKSFKNLKLLARYNINLTSSLKLFFIPLLNFTFANLFIKLKAIIIKNKGLIRGNYRLASYKHYKSCR